MQLNPRTADVALASAPAGLQLSLASETLAAPFTRTVIARSVTTVSAPTPQGAFSFGSWSDGLGADARDHGARVRHGDLHRDVHATSTDASLAGTDIVGTNTSDRPRRPRRGLPDRRRRGPAGATSLRLYLDASSRASKVVLGLYADAGGEPGALLGSATITAPAAGAWNTATLAHARVADSRAGRRTGSRCSTRPTRPAAGLARPRRRHRRR